MSKRCLIPFSEHNTSLEQVQLALFCDGQNSAQSVVRFLVKGQPFLKGQDEAILRFVVLDVRREGGHKFKIRGFVSDPTNVAPNDPRLGLYKAVVTFDFRIGSGSIWIGEPLLKKGLCDC
ncbi:MAG: hypothetical protein UT86_C0001G0077 [Candidatus Magasanikbacteria bacterium GW2011_GWC2_40_17]|uniref:Uncharacterized protein n=1 Tax=Candidatus Magasanikbacteria bacterium GW2011_GWA2_42_32 TaxID=1619039 RepID=A0A0G1A8R8_9BACT|nr:MAG: hypothetical protein UT86_C0001G0077 [Candidatus Magasanikbacteria bacterium GW2011_GWC2_40_17]KKS57437.1 MAG: hypothetical protein UV20_C0001G0077 [Candidatus Magasanikbacteria bacterium GW2011_GWA2_42_32]OGH85571.1 MAG: hypothetical protein A2294_01675 [Candidatus Magasanikbacteria bacterium RIFOXYB2_FULL_38_10]